MMKKMMALILILVALCGTATAEMYPATARVVEINYADDTVMVEMFNGFLFAFIGCEDYDEGDGVSLIMDDKGTIEITDDEILMAQYCGWNLINWYMGE